MAAKLCLDAIACHFGAKAKPVVIGQPLEDPSENQ